MLRFLLILCLLASPAWAVVPIQHAPGLNSTLIMRDGDPGAADPAAIRAILPIDAAANRNLLTITNDQDVAAQVDDYANEAHIGLLAQRDSATTTDPTHRRYIKFGSEFGGDGQNRSYDWYTGVNASHVFILYDALDLTHRMWMPTADDTDLRSGSGATKVDINRTEGGTNGLAVYNGSSTVLFQIDGDGEASIGATPVTNVGLTIAGKATALRAFADNSTYLTFGRSGGTIGSGQTIGGIQFRGIDDSEYTGARIEGQADGAWATGDAPGRLVIHTTPDNSTTLTEAVRINNRQELQLTGGALVFVERSSDPANPSEGRSVMWQSDGTGAGDDGDVLIKITAGGVTKTATLVDFSALP